MPSATGFGYVAGGNISPAVFVMLSTSADHTVLQATAGALCIGVSGRSTHTAPLSGLDDGYNAVDGESVRIYVEGEVCGLTLGGTVAAGDRLKATTNGVAITGTAGATYHARALQAGVSGEIIDVIVEHGSVPA